MHGGFASLKIGFTVLERVDQVRRCSRRVDKRRHIVEKTLSNEVNHGLNRFGLMSGLEMIDITSSRQGAQIGLVSITKVFQHVNPGASSKGTMIPQMQIVLKDGLFSKNNISKINHLLCRQRGIDTLGKLNMIFNGIENSVNTLREVVMHIVEFFHFFPFTCCGVILP